MNGGGILYRKDNIHPLCTNTPFSKCLTLSLSLSFPILFQIPRKRTVGRLYYYYYYYYYHHPQQSPFIFLELVDGKNEIIFKDRKI